MSREIVELQQQVSQVLQQQQDLRSAVDTNNATLKTLVQQSLDGVNQLNAQMGSLQKVVQEVQANTGSSISSVTQTTQGLQDNLQEVQSARRKAFAAADRYAELAAEHRRQSFRQRAGGRRCARRNDCHRGRLELLAGFGAHRQPARAKLRRCLPGCRVFQPTLFTRTALRDFTGGKYDLSRQEFSDYIKNFPTNDLASNAQFYLGEIYYAQNDFNNAIQSYDTVLTNYPRSFKLAASLYKKGMAELELGLKASAVRDLREVERRFAGSDEARRAQAKLREIGATAPRTTAPRQ